MTKTTIFTNDGTTAFPATITLSQPVSTYDEIVLVVNNGNNGSEMAYYLVSQLILGEGVGVANDVNHMWYVLTNITTLTFSEQTYSTGASFNAVIGIKW